MNTGIQLRRDLLAIMFLAALLLFFFSDVFFKGRVIFPNNMTHWEPWAHYVDSLPKDRYENYVYTDSQLLFYPRNKLVVSSYLNLELPTWNPYILCGTPAYLLLSPIDFLFFSVFPLQTGMSMSAIFHVFLAGIFMFFYLRSIKLGRAAALLASASYMCSSFILSYMYNAPNSYALTWAPLLFLLFELMITRKKVVFTVLLAAALAIELYEVHPQYTAHIFYVFIAYMFLRLVMLRGSEKPSFAFLTIGRCLLAFLAAGLIYVVQAGLFYYAALSAGRTKMSFDFFEVSKYPVSNLMVMFSFDFFGKPMTKEFWAQGFMHGLTEVYLGPVIILLILVAVLGRKGPLKNFWLVIFAVALLVSMSNQLYHFLFLYMPGFSISRTRPTEMVTFAAFVLAGKGMNYALEERAKINAVLRGVVYCLIIISFVVCLAATSGLLVPDWFAPNVQQIFKNMDRARFLTASRSVLYSSAMLLAGLSCYVMYFRGVLNRSLFTVIISVLALTDISLINRGLVFTQDRHSMFLETGSIKYLEEDKDIYRVFSYRVNPVTPNTASVFGIQDARGYDSLMPGLYRKFLNNLESGIVDGTGRRVLGLKNPASLESPMLDLLNIKYMLTGNNVVIESGKWELVYHKEISIYKNKNFIPRSFFVRKAVVVSDPAEMLRRVSERNFDPRAEVLLEEDLGIEAAGGGSGTDQVKIVSYLPKKVVIDVSAREDGVLVLLDSYYPGWNVYVDGAKARVLKADYLFRAVLLKKGDHSVIMKFEPGWLKKYYMVAAAVSAGVIFISVVWVVGSRRRGKS